MAQSISEIPVRESQQATGDGCSAHSRTERAMPVLYEPGNVIGVKYELVSQLGEGGMGTVWSARNIDLDSMVAIKLIRNELSSGAGSDRLLREAQAAAKLMDPAIVRVFDFGRTEHGDPFIVMELLTGEDLAAAIKSRGRLSPKRAVRVLLPVLRGLGMAHEQGIVHRDLKPENIFLAKTRTGLQPKVVDFGIAQLEQGASLRLTTTGAMMGSPLYMSPEQAKGEQVDARADIWGLSVLLYEAITGRVPFKANNYNAVLCAVMTREPERPNDEVQIDDELWSLLSRGMQKDPDLRFASMREMGKLLADWLAAQGEHEDITGTALRSQWQHSLQPGDQLSTVFPPEPARPARMFDPNQHTQPMSRPRLPVGAKQRLSRAVRGQSKLLAAGAGFLLVTALGLWMAFGGSGDAVPAAPRLDEKMAAPTGVGKALPQISADSDKPAGVGAVAQPSGAAVNAEETMVASDVASASATPLATRRATESSRSAVRPVSKSRPVSHNSRAKKLKNPFDR